MGPYVWCALGALLGWVASRMTPGGFVPMVESMAVGVFGAFIGGEFLPQMLLAPPAAGASAVHVGSVAMSIAGAVACLLLLRVMRTAVGPMKPHKKRRAS